MATGTFAHEPIILWHENSKKTCEIIKKNCESFKRGKSNVVSIGTTVLIPYLSICLVGLVWFARYCDEMYSPNLYSYSELF